MLLTGAGLILGFVFGAVLWHAVETTSIMALRGRIEGLKTVFAALRLALIGVIALLWPVLVSCLYRWGRMDEAGRVLLMALRWRIVIWLVVIELILGQNLIGRFVDAWRGGAA